MKKIFITAFLFGSLSSYSWGMEGEYDVDEQARLLSQCGFDNSDMDAAIAASLEESGSVRVAATPRNSQDSIKKEFDDIIWNTEDRIGKSIEFFSKHKENFSEIFDGHGDLLYKKTLDLFKEICSRWERDDTPSSLVASGADGTGVPAGASSLVLAASSAGDPKDTEESSLRLAKLLQEQEMALSQGMPVPTAPPANCVASTGGASGGCFGPDGSPTRALASHRPTSMTVSKDSLKVLEDLFDRYEKIAQDTDVHVFNRMVSKEEIETITKLTQQIIDQEQLMLYSLPAIGNPTIEERRPKAVAILTGTNINGSDTESGGVSLCAATEVQRAHALASYVDTKRWNEEFFNDEGVYIGGTLLAYFFYKISENLETGGGCSAGIRGRATEVQLMCLDILKRHRYFVPSK